MPTPDPGLQLANALRCGVGTTAAANGASTTPIPDATSTTSATVAILLRHGSAPAAKQRPAHPEFELRAPYWTGHHHTRTGDTCPSSIAVRSVGNMFRGVARARSCPDAQLNAKTQCSF